MRRITGTRTLLVSLMLMLALAPGCTRASTVKYVAQDRKFAARELAGMASKLPAPSFEGEPVSEAPELRQTALTALRAKSGTQPLADLLTDAFPSPNRSVPYYVERATVDGRDAWIVVEVWGSADGMLDKSRVWAFDAETSDVIVSSVF